MWERGGGIIRGALQGMTGSPVGQPWTQSMIPISREMPSDNDHLGTCNRAGGRESLSTGFDITRLLMCFLHSLVLIMHILFHSKYFMFLKTDLSLIYKNYPCIGK